MSILTPFVGFNGFIVTEERSEEMVSSNNFLDENDKSDFDKNIVETEETGMSKTSKDNLPIIPAEEISKVNEESKFDTELPENKTTIESTGPEETKDGQKGLINGEVATYTWGSVSWTWDAATKTIELESGDAGKVVDAPWKKYPSVVKIIFKDKVVFPSDSSEMFFGALQDLEIIENGRNIDVSGVTNMSGMFMFDTEKYTSSLTELDVSSWDVSSVTNMNGLFYKASSLKELDISSFDMQNVETMWGLFTGTKLEKLTLGIENKFSADADLGVPYLSDSTPAEKWIRINGTNAVSPTELMNNYGNGDLIAGTYIAEREQLSISHFDPVTVSIGDEVTTSFNLNLNLYPTTREKGSIFNINYVLPSENLVEYDSSVKVRIIDSNEQVLETIFLPISLQKDGFTIEMKLSAEQLSAAKTINVVASGRAWNNTSGMNSASLEVEHPAWGGENVEVAKLAHEINHDFEITNGPIKIQNLPDQLNFDIKKLSNTLDGTLIDLKTNNFGISILDYRGTNAISQTDTSVARQDWELFLTADDFIDQKNNVVNSDTLSLVYIKDGQNHEISSSDEVKIESHSVQGETAKDNHLHELSWKDEEGLKVCVKNKNNLKADWKYHSSITFELRQAP